MAGVIYLVNLAILELFSPGGVAVALRVIVGGAYAIVTVWLFIDCGWLEGTKGPNRFGPSPKDKPSQVDVF